jgi:NCS1 family nucleobase:cation symporter-1
MMPWKLLANYETYLYTWLVGYSGFLGPIAGILICDYFLLRKKIILVEDLYLRGGFYEFSKGFNWNGIAALAAGCGVAFIGLFYEPLKFLYSYAWFVGFAVGFVTYYGLMGARQPATEAAD